MTNSSDITSQNSQQTDAYEIWRSKEIEKRIAESVPERYVGAKAYGSTIHSYVEDIALNIAQGRGLFLTGESGVGKTYLACAAVIAAVRQRYVAKLITGGNLIRKLNGAITAGTSEEVVLRELNACKLLVIDDLGREPKTEKTLYRLLDVVNERTSRMLTTIYTTNYSEQRLIKEWAAIGDRETAKAILSRIAETTEKVVMVGEDRRLS